MRERTEWYVQGDPNVETFEHKSDAEHQARVMFPNETESQRYARVFYRVVDEDKIVTDPTAGRVASLPISDKRYTMASAHDDNGQERAPYTVVDNANQGCAIRGPFLARMVAQMEADAHNAQQENRRLELLKHEALVRVTVLREQAEAATGVWDAGPVEEAITHAVHALQDAERLLGDACPC